MALPAAATAVFVSVCAAADVHSKREKKKHKKILEQTFYLYLSGFLNHHLNPDLLELNHRCIYITKRTIYVYIETKK